jgi:N-methylhydantoinase A
MLTDGTTVQGPAAITEDETTIIVPAGFTATGRADGCIDIRRS